MKLYNKLLTILALIFYLSLTTQMSWAQSPCQYPTSKYFCNSNEIWEKSSGIFSRSNKLVRACGSSTCATDPNDNKCISCFGNIPTCEDKYGDPGNGAMICITNKECDTFGGTALSPKGTSCNRGADAFVASKRTVCCSVTNPANVCVAPQPVVASRGSCNYPKFSKCENRCNQIHKDAHCDPFACEVCNCADKEGRVYETIPSDGTATCSRTNVYVFEPPSDPTIPIVQLSSGIYDVVGRAGQDTGMIVNRYEAEGTGLYAIFA